MFGRTIGMVIAASLACGAPAFGQAQPSIDAAFEKGLEACARNVTGALPFNPWSPALDAAGLLAADPVGAEDLAPFKDLPADSRSFAAVASNGGSTGQGSVAVASAPGLCRVVLLDRNPADIAAVQARVQALSATWMARPQPDPEAAGYEGSIAGSAPLAILVRQPAAKTGFGSAGVIVTLTTGQ